MKAVVAAFNQEKALVGASSVITNLRMELFEALERNDTVRRDRPHHCVLKLGIPLLGPVRSERGFPPTIAAITMTKGRGKIHTGPGQAMTEGS